MAGCQTSGPGVCIISAPRLRYGNKFDKKIPLPPGAKMPLVGRTSHGSTEAGGFSSLKNRMSIAYRSNGMGDW